MPAIPVIPVFDMFLGCGLNDELRRIGSRLPAGKADSRGARRCECQVVGAIACDVGSHIHADPHPCAKGTAGSEGAADRGRVVVIDR